MSMKRWGTVLGSLALALACARTGHAEEGEEKEEKAPPAKGAPKDEKIPLDTTSSVADLLKGAMSADAKVYKHCTDSLLARGSKAVADLTQIACDPKQELAVRRLALSFLTEGSPNDCSDAIEKLLADPVKELRIEAVRACAKAQAEELVAPLQKAAADPKTDPDVVRECWKALYALHERKAGKTPLAELFRRDLKNTANAGYRWEAARTLGDMKEEGSVEALTAALKDPNDRVRTNAARALGKIGKPASIPALIGALEDDNQDVVEAALQGLRAMTGQDFSTDPDKWKAWWKNNSAAYLGGQ